MNTEALVSGIPGIVGAPFVQNSLLGVLMGIVMQVNHVVLLDAGLFPRDDHCVYKPRTMNTEALVSGIPGIVGAPFVQNSFAGVLKGIVMQVDHVVLWPEVSLTEGLTSPMDILSLNFLQWRKNRLINVSSTRPM
ncbi:hypothetical protein CEXT_574461 [Caerostris extrusa]|uniref:Uncharacterized protein n=1 Tax=Caerostris extrusa TaxID=172846 RepID=A0AAV4XX05_CAEEX|nr:hypothetical protein CEXT_574461 [Caerostris extrusa]